MGMDPFLPTLLGIFMAIPLGLIPAFIAKNKGYNFFLWWLYGWGLFIVAIIHASLLEDKSVKFNYITPNMNAPMQPTYQQPVYPPPAQPAYQPPVYQQPVQPVYQQPVQPTYQQPVYQQPVQPVYQQPTYQQPVQPVYQQPAEPVPQYAQPVTADTAAPAEPADNQPQI